MKDLFLLLLFLYLKLLHKNLAKLYVNMSSNYKSISSWGSLFYLQRAPESTLYGIKSFLPLLSWRHREQLILLHMTTIYKWFKALYLSWFIFSPVYLFPNTTACFKEWVLVFLQICYRIIYFLFNAQNWFGWSGHNRATHLTCLIINKYSHISCHFIHIKNVLWLFDSVWLFIFVKSFIVTFVYYSSWQPSWSFVFLSYKKCLQVSFLQITDDIKANYA